MENDLFLNGKAKLPTNMNETNIMFHLQCMDVAVTAGIFNQSQLSKVKKFVASKVDRRQLGGRCLDFSTLFCDAKKAQFLTIVSYHGTKL